MHILLLPLQPRFIIYTLVVLIAAALGLEFFLGFRSLLIDIPLVVFISLAVIGTVDVVQKRHAVLRNYPLSAHIRFILEEIRPEIRQYFLESEKDGTPFSRDKRALVYQRAKRRWTSGRSAPSRTSMPPASNGSIIRSRRNRPPRSRSASLVGGPDCAKPYSASIFNISAMSFGALSANAIRALNGGAKKGDFAHDTGEGGYSPLSPRKRRRHHLGDRQRLFRLPQRRRHGSAPSKFAAAATNDQVKMIEIKLSQGAKPGHGGVLPGAKVTSGDRRDARRAGRRRLHLAVAAFGVFDADRNDAVHRRACASCRGGKPAGFKLCIGHPWEFMAICKAMLETGIYPDFIVVDGKEGGTGAAPLEFTDHLGMPLREGLNFVHNALIGINARSRIKLGAGGKIITAFDIARVMALGADWCNSARGFMFALGCIQSLSCHTDRCPTGVATQDPARQRALVVPDKAERVYNFHRATIEFLAELVGAAGLDHPSQFALVHFSRRVSQHEVKSFAELYPPLKPGELLSGTADRRYATAWDMASAEEFRALPRAA